MQDKNLISIAEKVYARTRLTEEDALTLFNSPDLIGVGKLANFANRRINGDTVYYNINRHINPTNICALSCKFCAFSRKPGEEGAYAYDTAEILEKAGQAVSQGATEIHMVGGLHPRWPFRTYLEKISAIHQAHPQVHIKAFTVVELDWMAKRERRTISEILKDLRDAGLGSLPGGGAEIFHPEIREKICDTKVTAEQWIDTHRHAHSIGMRSNCTMLYGHIENYFHRVDHMRRLRDLQDQTNGFNVFIPLAFQPFENEMGVDRYTFGFDDLKTLAVARLYLDNFKNIKAYWVMLGQDTAQLGLNFGANDFDGTVTEEKISRMAGGQSGMSMSRNDLESLIRRCGRIPVERDTLYRPVKPEEAGAVPRDSRLADLNSSDQPDLSSGYDALQLLLTGDLNPDTLTKVASECSLFELGDAARSVGHSLTADRTHTYSPAIILKLSSLKIEDGEYLAEGAFVNHLANKNVDASSIVIDAGGIFDESIAAFNQQANTNGNSPSTGHSIAAIESLILSCQRKHPEASIVFAGLRALWFLARHENLLTGVLVAKLRSLGVDVFESSPEERECDLTPVEIKKLHESCHAADAMTVGKVDLVAGSSGNSAPQWDSYVRRLLTLREVYQNTRGLKAVQVVVAPHSQITAAEYLRALAVARIVMPKECAISAPLTSIPTHSPGSSIGVDGAQHPAEKTASVVFAFGANDLGHIPLPKISCLRIAEDIASAGAAPKSRTAKFDPQELPELYNHNIGALQHRPSFM